jgi:hypothetical protein
MSAVLLMANQTLAGGEVSEFVKSRLRDEAPHFTLLVPATPQAHREQSARLVGLIGGVAVPRQDAVQKAEEAADYDNARARLEFGLSTLLGLGATVDGVVGDPNPSKAISDVLASRQFDEVVVFTLPKGISRWLHLDLPHQVERKFHVPVTVITPG